MRNLRRLLAAALAATVVTMPGVGFADASVSAKPKTYKNCDAMHRDLPHGVGRRGAKDKTSGTPVTTFKRNNALYEANKGSDRDGDKIACEAA